MAVHRRDTRRIGEQTARRNGRSNDPRRIGMGRVKFVEMPTLGLLGLHNAVLVRVPNLDEKNGPHPWPWDLFGKGQAHYATSSRCCIVDSQNTPHEGIAIDSCRPSPGFRSARETRAMTR